jgi:hypothetical protein
LGCIGGLLAAGDIRCHHRNLFIGRQAGAEGERDMKMRKPVSVAVMAAMAVGLFAASAADARRKPVVKAVAVKIAPAFKAADINTDRQLDSSEWAGAGYSADAFTKVDRNESGTVGFLETLMATLWKLKARGSQ